MTKRDEEIQAWINEGAFRIVPAGDWLDRGVALMREPAPDGKALRELRRRLRPGVEAAPWVIEAIDHLLTSAPVADAEVAPVREGALQGTPTRMTDADRREVDALKKRAFDEASAIVEPTPAEWCDQIMDVVARSRTRTGLSEPIRLDMDEIVCDRSELERAAKWLRTALADMLAIAQQVGIVYEADYCAPVAGPTPAILRAITKMQRDAGDADQLRSAGLSLRAENARLQTDLAAAEQRQQNAEGIAAQQSVRAERAEGEAMVLRADLAAARADQAAMARRELEWLLQAMSRWHQAVTDLTPSAGNRRGAIEDVVGTLRLRLAALPQPKPAAEPVPASIAAPQRGDWPEDAVYENGSYQGLCSVCGGWFTGHKRRVVCKTCYDVVLDAPQRQQPAVDEPKVGSLDWFKSLPPDEQKQYAHWLNNSGPHSAPAAWRKAQGALRGPVSESAVFDEAEQQTRAAAIPPLPIDEGRVRDDLADFRDWMIDNMRFVECLRIGSEHHPLGGAIQVTDYYIAEINKRLSALAGKETP